MPEGVSEMCRLSKVSSLFGRDAFATMRYVTLLNVSETRDISNDERKVPFKKRWLPCFRDIEFSERHVNQSSETTKSRNHQKRKCGKAITIVLWRQKSLCCGCKILSIFWHNKQYVVRTITSSMGSLSYVFIVQQHADVLQSMNRTSWQIKCTVL